MAIIYGYNIHWSKTLHVKNQRKVPVKCDINNEHLCYSIYFISLILILFITFDLDEYKLLLYVSNNNNNNNKIL